MKQSVIRILACACSFAGAVFAAEVTYTPASAEWGTALTVANGDVVTIAAGTTAKQYWNGAITVGPGGTMRTTGLLATVGTLTVQCATTDVATNGKLEVVSGNFRPTFGSRTMDGDLVLASGATLTLNVTDAFKYDGAAKTFDISGTLALEIYRQTLTSEMIIKFHDGASVVGAGDGNGGPDFYKTSRVLCDGLVLFDSPVRVRSETVFACPDNTTLKFTKGFGNGSANIKFEAATTDEGGTGTCANLKLEITDGGASTSPLTLRGDARFTLASTVKHALTLADNASLTLVATEAPAKASHVFALTLPTISGSGTCALAGDGVIALGAEPALPIVFDGATVLATVPCALPAGSSVASATKILVNDLAAGETTTLFTGTDVASFDVTKLTVQPAHLDVPVGTGSVPAIVDGALVANNVADYTAAPTWIEPYLARKALIWLDAADGSNFTFDGANVTCWKDKSLYGRNATSYEIKTYGEKYGTYDIVDGVPAYKMGEISSGIDLQYTRMTTIRSAFWVMSLRLGFWAYFLGDTKNYDFCRGEQGQYAYINGASPNSTYFCDGVQVASTKTTNVPTDRHVYSCKTASNLCSDRLTCDRETTGDCYKRNAGRDISELICLDVVLADADRQAIEAYLAAKWMGDTPTAGDTAVSATMTSALAVTGSQSYTLPVELAEGASITITNPVADTPAISSTGAITVSGTTIPLTVDAISLSAGTYTLIEGGAGTSLSLENFSANLRPPAGGTATLAVQDGKLVLIVTADGGESSTLTWRPTSAAELVWSTDTVSWLDSDTRTAFRTGAAVLFDSGETQSGAVTVNDTVTIGAMRVTGANNYAFEGAGTMDGAATVVFAGTGTTTLNGPNFGAQTIDIQSGTVVLGRDAGANALGTESGADGGTVNVAAGAQFNLNTCYNMDVARANITEKKTFKIAGAGPDGKGALINTISDGRTSHTECNYALRRIELTDDATIGSVDRLDVRPISGTTTTTVGGIYGEGKTLTVVGSGIFSPITFPIQLQKVVIPTDGIFRPEVIPEASVDIPDGILLDGGILQGYQQTFPAAMPLSLTANGGSVQSTSGDTTFKGPLTVPEGVTLRSWGSATTYFSGAITNQGTIKAESGTTVLAGATAGDNYVEQSGGTLWLRNKVEGEETVKHSGGTLWIDTGTEVDHLTVTSTTTAPYLYNKPNIKTLDFNGPFFGIKTDTLVGPTVETANLTLGNSSFDILPQADGWVDLSGTYNVNKTSGTMYVYGPSSSKTTHGVKMLMKGTIVTGKIGIQGNQWGGLELKEGSDVTFTSILSVGGNGNTPGRGQLIIDAGARVTVTGSDFFVGEYPGDPAVVSTHTIDVSGTLSASNVELRCGWDAPRAEVILREGGVVAAKTLRTMNVRPSYGNGVDAKDGHHKFFMKGGRLDLGEGGLQCRQRNIPGVNMIDLANGEVRNFGDWGATFGSNVAFGEDALGGKIVFNLDGDNRLVNWNTALLGASDVTITGTGRFTYSGGPRTDRAQGALIGKLTIANTGTINDLRTASVFGGGLELAANTVAEVGSWGDEKYAYNVTHDENAGLGDALKNANGSAWSFNYASANFFTFMHTTFTGGNDKNPYQTNTGFSGRGEFYVPEDKAGTWSFAGQYDDWVDFWVDGTNVVHATGKCVFASGTIKLAAGWHTFAFGVADNTGGCQPTGGWQNYGMSLGFDMTGANTGNDPSKYKKFAPGTDLGDGTTLQIRPYANACIWSYQNGNGNWDTTENWAHIKARKSVDIMHMWSKSASGVPYAEYFASKANRFAGWFKVEDNQAGEWTFHMAYDDQKLLNIDGERVVNTSGSNQISTGKKTLTPGWHRWEARVQDGTGWWGPITYNNGNTLSYVAPDSTTEKQWNETNLKLAATLGDIAILEKTGIYRDLVVNEGATLTSSGSEAMGIYGTLKGNGTLTGSFAFKGTSSAWEVAGDGNKRTLTTLAKFSDPTRATFVDLAKVKATFSASPQCVRYPLATVSELTNDDVADATCEVKDASGNDYSHLFSLKVVNGQLVLANASPSGTIIMIR